MMQSGKRCAYFIGFNGCGQMGFGHNDSVTHLTKSKYEITKIFGSNQYTFFADDKYKHIWCAGYNHRGQLGLGADEDPLNESVITEGFDPENQMIEYNYFKENDIKISKICVSPAGSTTFFMTEDDQIYGCGNQLGLGKLIKHFTPVLISELENVVDMIPASHLSLALCRSDDKTIMTITEHWCRLFAVPDDIILMIVMFSTFSTVYSTVFNGYGHKKKYKKGWYEMEELSQRNIIKISAGVSFAIYLDSNGNVYANGENDEGQLGLGFIDEDGEEYVEIPTEIEYFKTNDIKIVDISCGQCHSLAVDVNGRLYAWGRNVKGQCGSSETANVSTPKLMESLVKYKVDVIRCGWTISYCRTKCGKNFIWGQNDDNECLTYDNTRGYQDVCIPTQIDDIVTKNCDCNVSNHSTIICVE